MSRHVVSLEEARAERALAKLPSPELVAIAIAKRELLRRALLERHVREQLAAANEAAEELYRLRNPAKWVGPLGKLDPPARDIVRRVVADRLTYDASCALIGRARPCRPMW